MDFVVSHWVSGSGSLGCSLVALPASPYMYKEEPERACVATTKADAPSAKATVVG